jgi:hypothetical protein
MNRALFQVDRPETGWGPIWTPIHTEVLTRIRTLYAIEAEIRGHPAEHRRRVRQERSRPIVETLHT